MPSITAVCRAKVNLTLDVLDRRPDGYHNLASVMQSVGLADTLHIVVGSGDGIVVESNLPGLPSGEGNTVYRACRLFVEAAGVEASISVRIEKRVPMEAGLGGGSSDAAGTLFALNSVFKYPLPVGKLTELCAEVGSDVPFFLSGGTALVTGRGETVEKLPDVPRLDLVIIKPDFGVSTGWAYSQLAQTGGRYSGLATDEMVDAIRRDDGDGIVRSLSNDFEDVVIEEYPAIASMKRQLTELGAENALLSGSGAAVFGIFASSDQAKRAARALEGKYPFVEATRTETTAIELTGGIDEG